MVLDPGVKKAPDPGSGSAKLIQNTRLLYSLQHFEGGGGAVLLVFLLKKTLKPPKTL